MAQLGLVSLLWENFLIDHQLPVWVFLRGIDICTIIHSWPSTVSLLSCLGTWGPSTNFIKICNRLKAKRIFQITPNVFFYFVILVNTFSKKDNHHLHHHLCLIATIITRSKRGLEKVVKFGVRRPCLFLRQHRPWMKTFFWSHKSKWKHYLITQSCINLPGKKERNLPFHTYHVFQIGSSFIYCAKWTTEWV